MYLYNFFILPIYLISILICLSSSSWILIWMGMEMNLLTFLFIILSQPMNMMKTESSMKYFLIQSVGSMIFLLSINSNLIFYNEKFYIYALVPPMALMLKSGMAPLHFWTPLVVSKFSISSLFLFLTIQKIIPFFILFSSWSWFTLPISILNIIMGSIGGMIQSSITKLMIFSSINNTGWMLMSMMQSMNLFNLYFLNYFLISIMLIHFLKKNQVKWMLQIKFLKMNMKWFYFSIIMSMSGFPPFMGFSPKWIVMKYTMKFNLLIICISIFMSILTVYFYLKSSLNLMLKSSSAKKWNTIFFMKPHIITLVNFSGPILFFLIN